MAQVQSIHRRVDSGPEAGTRGFTAINITPPQSRGTLEQRTSAPEGTNGAASASSTASPDTQTSPRQSNVNAGQHFGHEGSSNSLKRRRSGSLDQRSTSPSRYDQNPARMVDPHSQQMADRALHALDSANIRPSHSYYASAEPDHQAQTYERAPYNGQNMSPSSAPENRPGQAYSASSSEHLYQGTDDGRNQNEGTQTGPKRKRNFSNRTKTGCLTCRERKKKCDEGRPICTNCIRGSFTCRGYNNGRSDSWPKPPPQKQHIALQSKEGGEAMQYENTTPVSAHANNELRSGHPEMNGLQPRSAGEASQSHPRPQVAADGQDMSRPQYGPNPANTSQSQQSYPGSQQQHQHHQQQQSQWPHHHVSAAPPVSNTAHQQQTPSTQHQVTYSQDNLPRLSELSGPDQQAILNQPSSSGQGVMQQPQQQNTQQRQEYTMTAQREMARPASQAQSAGPTSAPTTWQQPPPQSSAVQQNQPSNTQQHNPPHPPPQHHVHPQSSQPNHPHQHQYPPQAQQDYSARPSPYPPRIDTNQSQYNQSGPRLNTANTANTASASYSSYEAKAGSKLFTTEDVERSRMLRGANYNYFDKTLHNERQRCANALLRYNNACQLGSGVSDQELQNMLLKVFIPKRDQTHSFLAANTLEGGLGPGVKIEPGFRCTYGYNIRIYDNVFIGENTRIDDSAKVEIGSRTWVGANVTILTNEVSKETQNRKGTDGQPCYANSVYIGSEVVIGTGAVILPGRRLGKGSTVEPFAVVKSDLADYETQKVYEGPRMGFGPGYSGMMG